MVVRVIVVKIADMYSIVLGEKRVQRKKLWNLFANQRQIYSYLARNNGLSVSTIQRRLDQITDYDDLISQGEWITDIPPQSTVLGIDATFFGSVGIIIGRSSSLKKTLYFKVILSETIAEYENIINKLTERGWIITALVSDGKGLRHNFGIPVQMCHFHQQAIIRRYLTNNPRLIPNQELKAISRLLRYVDKQTFKDLLGTWYEVYGGFIHEKKFNHNKNKYEYSHKRTRSAYYSLLNNTDYLFVHEQYSHLNIPKTNNSCEGTFSALKDKVNIHR
ncbi:MAG: hypothetical protein U9Q15_03310 [Patescibacteria group bacterium]|nr:hypothetical protein [Patescibacteria group bacterium]